MSRTGVEAKLPWKDVPKAVRQQIHAALGAPVVRATRVWGGYAPTPTYRLALADGRRAFFKGTFGQSNTFMVDGLRTEERVYHNIYPLLKSWMPQWYATVNHEDWHGLLLEDLGPKSVPPWTSANARAIAHAFADFHHASLGAEIPSWLSRPAERLARESWTQTSLESQEFQAIAALAGDDAPQALAWFQKISPTIDRMMMQPALTEGPFAILHGDLRSDNLRFTRNHLSLFDWPAITVGRPEWDMVAFAQTVTVEGGPLPEQVMAWYGERFPVNGDAVESALAWWLTFFADRAWRPELPGLPRVRRFQKQQLGVLACWASRHWSFPSPEWTRWLMA